MSGHSSTLINLPLLVFNLYAIIVIYSITFKFRACKYTVATTVYHQHFIYSFMFLSLLSFSLPFLSVVSFKVRNFINSLEVEVDLCDSFKSRYTAINVNLTANSGAGIGNVAIIRESKFRSVLMNGNNLLQWFPWFLSRARNKILHVSNNQWNHLTVITRTSTNILQ